MVKVLEMAQSKHIFNKTAAGFGSFAWNGGGQRELEQTAAALKWDFKGSLEFTGAANADDLAKARKFGADFAQDLKINHEAGGKNPLTIE
jgi:flavorubredoxin